MLLLCPEIFQSVSALLYRNKMKVCKQTYINHMLEPFFLFSAPAITVPLFPLRLQESRDQYPDPQKGLRALNWPTESGVTFQLDPTIII